MRKRLAVLLAALLMLGLLAGCIGDSLRVGASENASGRYWYLSYQKFGGTEEKTFTVSGDDIFLVEVVTEAGRLDMLVTGPDGETPYTGGNLQTGNFSFGWDTPGKYTITVTARDHKGGFGISVVPKDSLDLGL